MNPSSFGVLAELYRFLSQFSESDLAAAARHPGLSEDLRRALISLSRELSRARLKSKRISPQLARDSEASTENPRKPTPSTPSPERLESILKAFFADTKRFPTKGSLVDFMRQVGFEIRLSPKHGLPRAVGQVVREVMANPTIADRIYNELISRRDPQTSGWFDLILRSRQ